MAVSIKHSSWPVVSGEEPSHPELKKLRKRVAYRCADIGLDTPD
jgi:hypothetical protein